jgi:putative endonuclease
VYTLTNEKNQIYIGYTSDLEKRLERHNGHLPNKKSSFSHKNGSHWTVRYTEEFSTRAEAMRREKELKSFRGREFLRDIIKKDA